MDSPVSREHLNLIHAIAPNPKCSRCRENLGIKCPDVPECMCNQYGRCELNKALIKIALLKGDKEKAERTVSSLVDKNMTQVAIIEGLQYDIEYLKQHHEQYHPGPCLLPHLPHGDEM